jgi:hypothetical protein
LAGPFPGAADVRTWVRLTIITARQIEAFLGF